MKKTIYSEKQRILCAWLATRRKSAGMTQMQLAARLKKPQSFVSKYESGERLLDVIELLEIIKVLKANPKDLLSRLV